jgi:hypothetical protein
MIDLGVVCKSRVVVEAIEGIMRLVFEQERAARTAGSS